MDIEEIHHVITLKLTEAEYGALNECAINRNTTPLGYMKMKLFGKVENGLVGNENLFSDMIDHSKSTATTNVICSYKLMASMLNALDDYNSGKLTKLDIAIMVMKSGMSDDDCNFLTRLFAEALIERDGRLLPTIAANYLKTKFSEVTVRKHLKLLCTSGLLVEKNQGVNISYYLKTSQ